MKRTVRGFLITAALWLALVCMYSIIELVRGHVPFAMLQWDVGGKFILFTVLLVLGLGTGVGYASDRIQARMHRG